MHLLGICFVDSYGFQVKWQQKIIRAIVIILLYASSAYLYGIPLLVNALVMLISPSRRSPLDYASNETCIECKSSVILEDSK